MIDILKNNKKLKMLSVIEIICLVLTIMLVGLFFLFLFCRLKSLALICVGIFLAPAAIILIIRKYLSRREVGCYVLPLDNNLDYAAIKARLEDKTEECISNSESGFAACMTVKKRFYRITLCKTVDFNKKQYYSQRKSVNKALNKKYNLQSSGPIGKVSAIRKLNILFVDNENESLRKVLAVPADQYVNMASAMLNVAVAEGRLFIPGYAGYDLGSAFVYDELVKYTLDLFCISADD